MESELAIKIDYLKNRTNPSEVFEAMALYIDVYRDFGQLLTNSVGIKADFKFQLSDIEKGSILSKLSVVSDLLDRNFKNATFSCGIKLFEKLADIEKIEEESEVESLAVVLEEAFANRLQDQIVDPHIDRQNLADMLSKLSSANQKTMPGENVYVISADEKSKKLASINTRWRFTGDPKKMFMGKTQSHEIKDNLYVPVTVNEGNSIWTFKSLSLDKRFKGRIVHKEWLKEYQGGLIQPIGPNDVLEADLTYDLYTPPQGKGKPQIRNAKIKKVVDIHRNSVHQHEL